eukprot:585696-Lingulodinium_polyedra.AAC.1
MFHSAVIRASWFADGEGSVTPGPLPASAPQPPVARSATLGGRIPPSVRCQGPPFGTHQPWPARSPPP